jgi:ribonuclease P protein component
VVHLLPGPVDPGDPVDTAGNPALPTQVGFVVSRAVGNAVVRHRVQRRLRHLVRDRLAGLPSGSQVVVRALAPAARASYAELGAELDRCLLRALGDSPVRGQGSVS